MKIKFKKKRLRVNLILGIVWIVLGTLSIVTDDKIRWTDYGYLVIGIPLYVGHYLYDLKNQYLTIENGTIRKNGLYGYWKKINLNEINWIKKFAGDYTLKTEEQGIVWSPIQPGKPAQNAIVERFNRTFREDVLDASLFTSIEHAQEMADNWVIEYNTQRPHQSLGYKTPLEYAA